MIILILLLLATTVLIGSLFYHWLFIYQKPFTAPPGMIAPPLALVGKERIPIIGYFHRLKAIITDPVGLAASGHQHFGQFFTVRIPFQFDLTYIIGHEAYQKVMRLHPEEAQIGQVMQRVPTVGYWYTRERKSAESLQELIIVSKRFMAQHLTSAEAVKMYAPIIRRTALAHTQTWHGRTLDLTEEIWKVVYHASGNCLIGKELWNDICEEVMPLFRAISNGTDIVRVTKSVMPFAFMMPEYKATKKLEKVLNKVLKINKETGRFPLITKLRELQIQNENASEKDVSWMLMYILWNGMTYTGSYIFWALADIINTPAVLAHWKAEKDITAKHRFLGLCFCETMRLHPVTSLVRTPKKPLVIEVDGKQHYIPNTGYVGVFTQALNRDAKLFENPTQYDPFRFLRGENMPSLYGQGAFGCIAQQFTQTLATITMSVLLQRFDYQAIDALPERMARVHLTYPNAPYRVQLTDKLQGELLDEEVADVLSHYPQNIELQAKPKKVSKCPFHHALGLS